MGPIFNLFIKRAAILMSSIDFTVPHLPPLPDNMSMILESIPFKLATTSNALLKLYNAGCDSRKSSFLEVVEADQIFVYNAIKLACKVLQLYGKLCFCIHISRKRSFLEVVEADQIFVYNAIKLAIHGITFSSTSI